MGGSVSRFNKKELRILMLGLDSAGKTTVLYHIKTNSELNTVPTVGFNVETIKYKSILLNLWDVGGQDKIRPLWRHYYTGSQVRLKFKICFLITLTPGPYFRRRLCRSRSY